MCRNCRMIPLSSDRKGGTLNMPCSILKNLLRGGMINRNSLSDFGDVNITHHAILIDVQTGHIFLILFRHFFCLDKAVRNNNRRKSFVVCTRPLPFVDQAFIHEFFICSLLIFLKLQAVVIPIPLVRKPGIKQYGKAKKESDCHYNL